MKLLATASLLAAALVLTSCGGSGDTETKGPTESNLMVDDTQSLGLLEQPNPDAPLCDRLSQRYPQNWWTLAEFLGQDLVDTCLTIYQVAAVVGDCLVRPKGSCPGVDLRGVDLRGKPLAQMNLSGADLSGADLRGTKLGEVNLTGANLTGAKAAGAFMTFAKLDRADLSGTTFTDAMMYGVSLRGATIEGTNFSGAELRDAIWVDGRKCSLNSPRGQCT